MKTETKKYQVELTIYHKIGGAKCLPAREIEAKTKSEAEEIAKADWLKKYFKRGGLVYNFNTSGDALKKIKMNIVANTL